ncbi:MAG: N-acetyl-gamma-glutamyl-phosphate reductase [Phycisphaerales bacterium]|jgi:N-acetyl-gamma-glutamyl-phosphate reductase|nr:N-acetyl-gamma-glutamyl-phosphate reductase [Phycisphaerales bacterium]
MSHGRVRTIIIGAAGYTGFELARILARHPHAEIAGLFRSGDADTSMGELFPRLRGVVDLPVRATSDDAISACRADAAFLATPHEASAQIAPRLLDMGLRVFDLSGAFRLGENDACERVYGFRHASEPLLANAVYGLPELNREAIVRANLVSCPGCYPTSAIIPLRPLVEAGAIEAGWTPIIDATSGVSGAGRTPTLRNLFCEVSQQPYGVLTHRHNPEIDRHAGITTIFTPHLGPYERGIVSTIHVRLAPGWSGARVRELLAARYASSPFVRLLPAGTWPSVGGVAHTNFCDVGLACDEARRHLILVGAIDNLIKGASGQAIQCMNIRFDLPETAGLEGA